MPAVPTSFKAELVKRHHQKYELRVTGHVTEPTTGWTVDIERAAPQGINPKVLLLELIERRPTWAAADIVTTHRVRYDEDPPEAEYTQVTIDGAVTIDVHHLAYA